MNFVIKNISKISPLDCSIADAFAGLLMGPHNISSIQEPEPSLPEKNLHQKLTCLALFRFNKQSTKTGTKMNNFFRALIAGAAAKKFGGGCLGTIVIFAIVWVLLGQCSNSSPIRENSKPEANEKQVTTDFIQKESDQTPYKLAI